MERRGQRLWQHEGEKTHDDIFAYLEKAREHPTGKLWVDCFIIPTMLAHQFTRSEREGGWLLQMHCLEMMMPYFFVSGHHNYTRYISWHLRDMQHLPHDAKKDLAFSGLTVRKLRLSLGSQSA